MVDIYFHRYDQRSYLGDRSIAKIIKRGLKDQTFK